MNKTVFGGIAGGIALATGALFYMIYQRDKENEHESGMDEDPDQELDNNNMTQEIHNKEQEEALEKHVPKRRVRRANNITNRNTNKSKIATRKQR